MNEIGPQYSKDDRTDTSGFLRRARLHQSEFRAKTLNLPFDTYGNYLTPEDGAAGHNFYGGFEIFEAVKKRYRKYSKPLYANMLRSEHIPFNMFIPFRKNPNFLKNVLNEFLSNSIEEINRIEIEYAPLAKENYLADGTSFDAYIEFTHVDNSQGIIGVEVKYTEKEYPLILKSKQHSDINDEYSKYHIVTAACGLYKPESLPHLKTDKFRQVWRNHILGESILIADSDKFKYFTSLTLFPEGNSHFIHTSKEYIDLIVDNKNKFLPLTYEDFFAACNKYCPDNSYKAWLEYMAHRYIVIGFK